MCAWRRQRAGFLLQAVQRNGTAAGVLFLGAFPFTLPRAAVDLPTDRAACCPHGRLVSSVAQRQHKSWPQSTELLARRALGLLKSWSGGGSRRAEQRELILSLFIVVCWDP